MKECDRDLGLTKDIFYDRIMGSSSGAEGEREREKGAENPLNPALIDPCCDTYDVDALREEQEARLKPLYERQQDLDVDIYHFKTHCYDRIPRIAKNSFDSISVELLNTLSNQLPSCDEQDVWNIRQDLQSMMTNKKSYVCQSELEFIGKVTEDLWNLLENNVTSVINVMKSCTQMEPTCSFEEEYDKAYSTINTLNETLRAYENGGLEENWTAVKECYDNLASRIQERISEVQLPAQECDNIHGYEEILKRLSLFPLTVNKFVESKKSEDPKQCPDVSKLSAKLETDILDAKSQVKTMIKESSERFSKNFRIILKSYNKNSTLACYNDAIRSYESILSRIELNEDKICTDDLISVNTTLNRLMFVSLVQVQPLLYDVTSCQQQNETCKDCNHLLNQTLTEISTLRDKLSQYNPERLATLGNKMNTCFLVLEDKLTRKLIDIDRCDGFETKDLANAYLTLDELLSDQDMEELENVEVQDSNDDYPYLAESRLSGTEQNQGLLERLRNISDSFQEYANRWKSEIDNIFDESEKNLYTSIDNTARMMKNGLRTKMERQNFAQQLNKFNDEVEDHYRTKIKHICLRPFPDIIENITKIYEDEIPNLIKSLEASPNCEPDTICNEAGEYLINKLDIFSRIQEFDAQRAEGYAKTCLRESREQLCAVLKRSEILGERKPIFLPRVFQFNSLPKDINYPSTYTSNEAPMYEDYFSDEKSLEQRAEELFL